MRCILARTSTLTRIDVCPRDLSGSCQEKALEAIAFERLMTGSTLNLDREAKMVDMMAPCLERTACSGYQRM